MKLNRNGSALRRFLIVLILLIAVVVLGFFAVYSMETDAKDPKSQKYVNVTVPQGSTAAGIGSSLQKAGIIRSEKIFLVYTKFHKYGTQYQAGEYAFSPSMDMKKIAKILCTGKTNKVTFMVPEGTNILKLAEKLQNSGIIQSKDEFLDTAKNTDFRSEFNFLPKSVKGNGYVLEGYLFPATYDVPAGAKSEDIIRLMLQKFQSVYTDEDQALADKLGMSQQEVLAAASIIEKECAKDSDRPKVASVLYNRIKKGMKLQCDTTVQYALALEGTDTNEILYKHLNLDSPYNTYVVNGLPEGPICSPGRASIEAALNPADTDYLYFVLSSKLDGSAVFSKDYDTFAKDVEAYDQAVKARNAEKAQ